MPKKLLNTIEEIFKDELGIISATTEGNTTLVNCDVIDPDLDYVGGTLKIRGHEVDIK